MEQEVAEAQRLRATMEAQVDNLRKTADDLSGKLCKSRDSFGQKKDMVARLKARLQKAASDERFRTTELTIASEMHALACHMLQLVSARGSPLPQNSRRRVG
mmetsp:Transcript_24556/g.68347  ORF Transcript_24556/g.68347 Transcript_24556/m.68347 type:complete len:102 (+) Transcript_24556:590-895(+)